MRRLRLIFLWCLFALPAFAQVADTPLNDAALERRARMLFVEIRCVVCEGQAIADSRSEVAVALRRSVREQLKAGHTDDEILHSLAERYGEKVLMTPPFRLQTWLLWVGPLVMLALGGSIVFAYFSASRIQNK